MRKHIMNAACGALDYAAYPVGMLLLAPPILHALGIERYGIWILANATLGTGAILASGFGDANIHSAAAALGEGRRHSLISTVKSTLGIHVALGAIAALVAWLFTPELTHWALKQNSALASDSIWSLRITSGLIFIRAIETVCVSTQRAFCRYGSAITISVASRLLSLLATALVSRYTHTVTAVMISSLAICGIATVLQFHQLARLLNTTDLRPSFHPGAIRTLLRFGTFTWLQAASGLLFTQADRILAATIFGAGAAASYAFCVQLSMPIYGLAAAGLHFLFPLLAAQQSERNAMKARSPILVALLVNVAYVSIALTTLLAFGNTALRLWGGSAIASAGEHLLSAIAWSAALPALGVTGCYSLLAFGKPNIVSLLNFAGGLAMCVVAALLIPRYGIAGLAYGRIAFGSVALTIYVPLLNSFTRSSRNLTLSTTVPVYKDA